MSNNIPSNPNGIAKVFNGLLALYFGVAFLIATPYFNWQYAQQNGFIQWLCFNEFVPTFKAMAWPYFIYADYTSSHKDADERRAMQVYAQSFNEILAARQEFQTKKDMAMGRIHELGKTDLIAAKKLFADTLAQDADEADFEVRKMETMNPPSAYRELHIMELEKVKGQAKLCRAAIAALNSNDPTAFKAAMDHIRTYNQEWEPRIQAAKAKLQNSH